MYRAEDTRLKRVVALKFLSPECAHDSRAVERFQREAQATSALNHPNICTIHDFGEENGEHFIAMEFLDGETLSIYMHNRPMPIVLVPNCGRNRRRTRSGPQRGHHSSRPQAHKHFCHQVGARKDFGLWAGEASRPTRLTAHEIGSSTAHHAHQRRVALWGPWPTCRPSRFAVSLDVRTDLFSFGAVLYEMSKGRMAFIKRASSAIMARDLSSAPSVEDSAEDLPLEFERIIGKALERERDLRYQTAAEMRLALQKLKSELELEHRQSDAAHVLSPAPPIRRTGGPTSLPDHLLSAGGLWSVSPEVANLRPENQPAAQPRETSKSAAASKGQTATPAAPSEKTKRGKSVWLHFGIGGKKRVWLHVAVGATGAFLLALAGMSWQARHNALRHNVTVSATPVEVPSQPLPAKPQPIPSRRSVPAPNASDAHVSQPRASHVEPVTPALPWESQPSPTRGLSPPESTEREALLTFVPIFANGTRTFAPGFSAKGVGRATLSTPIGPSPDRIVLDSGETASLSFKVLPGQTFTVAFGTPRGGFVNTVTTEVSVNGEAIATVDGVPNGLYVRSPDTRLLWRKSFGPGEYVLSFRSTGWGINFYGLWLSGPLQLPSETPGWLGFANGIVEQDRDAELRLHCGNFKRVEVPYAPGTTLGTSVAM